mmetsp:Transcript_13241/g.33957  ORF Transcript_13241/g.33957 Transcript_13241/m.33957 type:complete len:84 (-) Transcript_13241:1042-1293(-)
MHCCTHSLRTEESCGAHQTQQAVRALFVMFWPVPLHGFFGELAKCHCYLRASLGLKPPFASFGVEQTARQKYSAFGRTFRRWV